MTDLISAMKKDNVAIVPVCFSFCRAVHDRLCRIQISGNAGHIDDALLRCRGLRQAHIDPGVRQLKIHKSSKSGLVAAFFVSSP